MVDAELIYSTNEDDRLKSFTKHRDERQNEESPLASPPLLAVVAGESPIFGPVVCHSLRLTLLEGGGELETPLDTRSVHLEEGNTHEVDDDARDEGEAAFPDLLGLAPEVGELRVELCRY